MCVEVGRGGARPEEAFFRSSLPVLWLSWPQVTRTLSMIGLSKGIKGLRSVRNEALEPLTARKGRMARKCGSRSVSPGPTGIPPAVENCSSSRLVRFLHLRLFPVGLGCENPGEVTLLHFGLATPSVGPNDCELKRGPPTEKASLRGFWVRLSFWRQQPPRTYAYFTSPFNLQPRGRATGRAQRCSDDVQEWKLGEVT